MPKLLGRKDKSTSGTRSLDPDTLLGTRKTFVDTYYVLADSINQTEDDILLDTPGLPQLRSLSANAYAVSKTAREVDAQALLWEVDVFYDSNARLVTPDVEWTWSAETMDEFITHDVITGAPIVNSVNEPLIITWPLPIPVLTISRIEQTFSAQRILQYMSTVNSSPFWGAPRGTALMAEIVDSPVDHQGQRKRRVTYVIKFTMVFDHDINQFRGWRARPLNHGTKYFLNPGGPDTVTFKTSEDGIPTTGNLELDGTARSSSLPPLALLFDHLRYRNFNSLRLGPFITL